MCRRVVLDDTDALDATQEALIAIVRGLDRFDGRASFKTWSYRVATNAALDHLRRRRRHAADELPAELPEPAAGGGVAGRVADRVAIDGALARLTPEFRAAVVLRDLAQLDYAEIAEVLDVPIGTVRSRIARGRAQLADLLADGPEPDAALGLPDPAAGNPGAAGGRPSTGP